MAIDHKLIEPFRFMTWLKYLILKITHLDQRCITWPIFDDSDSDSDSLFTVFLATGPYKRTHMHKSIKQKCKYNNLQLQYTDNIATGIRQGNVYNKFHITIPKII